MQKSGTFKRKPSSGISPGSSPGSSPYMPLSSSSSSNQPLLYQPLSSGASGSGGLADIISPAGSSAIGLNAAATRSNIINGNNNNNNSNNIKRDIACSPGTVKEFFMTFLKGISRKVLGVKAEHKLAVYVIVVFLGSLLAELFSVPKDLLLQRLARPFNTFVIRFGYGWILVITTPLIFITSRIYCHNNMVLICSNFARLFINTLCWFFVTNIFYWFHASSGICFVLSASNSTHAAMKNLPFLECKRSGYQWSGTDISGHTFLLIFSNLILLEEAKIMRLVDKILQQQQERVSATASSSSSSSSSSALTSSCVGLDPTLLLSSPLSSALAASSSSSSSTSRRDKMLLQLVLCLAGATCVIYDYVLLVTIFHYHTILEKMLALVVASACWYLCYRVAYGKMGVSPGQV